VPVVSFSGITSTFQLPFRHGAGRCRVHSAPQLEISSHLPQMKHLQQSQTMTSLLT